MASVALSLRQRLARRNLFALLNRRVRINVAAKDNRISGYSREKYFEQWVLRHGQTLPN